MNNQEIILAMKEYCTRYIGLDFRHELFDCTINTDQKMNLIVSAQFFSQLMIKQKVFLHVN